MQNVGVAMLIKSALLKPLKLPKKQAAKTTAYSAEREHGFWIIVNT